MFERESMLKAHRTFRHDCRRPEISAALNWRHLLALAQSSLRRGVIGRERFHYWRLLLWTLMHRPALLQLAVTLAIYGQDFRKCCTAIGA